MSKYFLASKAEAVTGVNLRDACVPLVATSESSIDIYYERAERLVLRAQKAQADGEMELIPLLFLRLISATESYVRDVLTRLPAICPLVWAHCSEQAVPLGSTFLYSKESIAVATLEHVSFSTKGEIAKQTKKIAGLEVVSDGSLRVAVGAFEAISELRHSIVHSYDELFYKNVRELNVLDSSSERMSVFITPLLFQNFVATCHSFVRAYNRFVLERVLDGWVREQVAKSDWADDRKIFTALFRALRSVRDAVSPTNAYLAHRAFVRTVRLSLEIQPA